MANLDHGLLLALARSKDPEQVEPPPGVRMDDPAEAQFQREIRATPWFTEFAAKNGGEPNLDDPDYDYRAAWKAGIRPQRYGHDGGAYHWASSLPDGEMLKSENHPTAWMEHFMRKTGVDPNELGLKSKEEGDAYLASKSGGASAGDPRTFGAMTTTSGGAVRNPYGLETEVRGSVDDIDANVARAREMYGQRQPAQDDGPGERERYLLEMMQRPDDSEITKAAIFGALLGDQKERLADVRGRQSEYDKQRLGAREADRADRLGKQPADLATVEMLVRSGMSPEAALSVSQNSPALKLAGQGGLNVDLKRRGQDIDVRQNVVKEAGATGRNMQNIESREGIAAAKLDAKKKGKGGGGTANPQAEADRLASFLVTHSNVQPEQARAYVAGDLSAMSKDVQDKLWAAATAFSSMDRKAQDAALKADLGREGATPDANRAQLDRKRQDPAARLKLKEAVNAQGRMIAVASKAWERMSDKGKALFVKLGGEGGLVASTARDWLMSQQDKAAAAEVQGLANVILKERSGAAVSGGEWTRYAQETGLPTFNFTPFNDPATIEAWLKRARAEWSGTVKTIKSEYGDIWSDNASQ